jgi:hypothetical protein
MRKSLNLLLMLLALGAGGRAFAAEPVPVAAVNLGFDKWENGSGTTGWSRFSVSIPVPPALGYDGVLYIDTVTPPEYR